MPATAKRGEVGSFEGFRSPGPTEDFRGGIPSNGAPRLVTRSESGVDILSRFLSRFERKKYLEQRTNRRCEVYRSRHAIRLRSERDASRHPACPGNSQLLQ